MLRVKPRAGSVRRTPSSWRRSAATTRKRWRSCRPPSQQLRCASACRRRHSFTTLASRCAHRLCRTGCFACGARRSACVLQVAVCLRAVPHCALLASTAATECDACCPTGALRPARPPGGLPGSAQQHAHSRTALQRCPGAPRCGRALLLPCCRVHVPPRLALTLHEGAARWRVSLQPQHHLFPLLRLITPSAPHHS